MSPQSTDSDALASFPTIINTARTIISHIVSQPRHMKAYEILSIPLLEHLLDLFCHVNLVDQRMDELEQDGQEEDPARSDEQRNVRDKFFSWTMLLKGIYCSSLLAHLTTSSSALTNPSSANLLQSLEHTIDDLFEFPTTSAQNGAQPNVQGTQKERLHRRWMNDEEKEASRRFRDKFKVALRDWRSSGKYEPFRFPTAGRIAQCVLNYIQTVEDRYNAFDISHATINHLDVDMDADIGHTGIPTSKRSSTGLVGLGNGIAPPLTPSSTGSPQTGRTSDRDRNGRREPSGTFIPDARGVEQGLVSSRPSINGKGKKRDLGMVDDHARPVGSSSSTRALEREDGNAARLRALRKSLNGGREDRVMEHAGSSKPSHRDTEGPIGGVGRHAHFDHVQEDQIEGEVHEGGAEYEQDIVDRQASVSVPERPPTRYVSESRPTKQFRYSSGGPFVAPIQRRVPRASLPSQLGPLRSPTMSRSGAGSVRERSVSVVIPNYPPGTILRVNEEGVAEVLTATLQQDEPDRSPSHHQEDPRYQQRYAEHDRGYSPHELKREEVDERFDGENLDEWEADEEYWQPAEEAFERTGSVIEPAPPPAGHRWVLLPDNQTDENSAAGRPPVNQTSLQQNRQHGLPSVLPARQADYRRMLPPQRQPRSASGPRQGEISMSAATLRSSVQPTGFRYVTPVPELRSRDMPNSDPRRRYTEHARPRQPFATERLSIEADRQALAGPRRRQAHSLGGASDNRQAYESTMNEGPDMSETHVDWADEHTDTASTVNRLPPQVATRPLTKASLREPVARSRVESHPYQLSESDRSPSVRPVPPKTANSSNQVPHQSSSPSLKRYRPFSDHRVLRNPQNAKRARHSGLSTGRPEFQLADGREDSRYADGVASARSEEQKNGQRYHH